MIIFLGKDHESFGRKACFPVRTSRRNTVWGRKKSCLPELKKQRILAFSGLARPESFEKTLRGLEAEIVKFEIFPDHYAYEGRTWRR